MRKSFGSASVTFPKPGDTIVDIGAGRGEDDLAFSQAVGPTGKVLAVEAQPRSFRMLKAFCEVNDLRNVHQLVEIRYSS
jgi:FkbM family methyltransferase